MVFAACEETSGVGVFEMARLPSRAVSLRKPCMALLEAEPIQGSDRSFRRFSATSLVAHKLSFAYLRVLCGY
jgi:hypothetical protein